MVGEEDPKHKHEVWYDGSLGGDLFRMRAQCMEVNARTYRWAEARRKGCEIHKNIRNEETARGQLRGSCVTGVWMRLWCM